MFAAIDEAASNATSGAHVREETPAGTKATTKKVIKGFGKELKRLKGIFDNKLSAYIFVLLALTYMVSLESLRSKLYTYDIQGRLLVI